MDRLDWEAVADWALTHGLRVALVVALAFVAAAVVRHLVPGAIRAAVVGRELEDRAEQEQRARTLAHVVTRTATIVLYVIALFMILPELGIDITPAVAGVSVGGIAVGFGAQSLVRDVLRGFMILTENQYAAGDYVTIAGVSGVVEELNLRRTVLRDADGKVHSVSNGDIIVATRHPREPAAVAMFITVGYDADRERVLEVINETGKKMAADKEWTSSLAAPPQALRFDTFDEVGATARVEVRAKPDAQWAVMNELRARIQGALTAEGIGMPRAARITAPAGSPPPAPGPRHSPEPMPDR